MPLGAGLPLEAGRPRRWEQAGRIMNSACAVMVAQCTPVAAAAVLTLGYVTPSYFTCWPNARRTPTALLARAPRKFLAAELFACFETVCTYAVKSGTNLRCSLLREAHVCTAKVTMEDFPANWQWP